MLLDSLKPHTASPKLQDLQNQLILPVPQGVGNSKSHLLPKWGSYSLLMKCLQGKKLPQPHSSPQCFESSPICSTYTYELSQAQQNSRLRGKIHLESKCCTKHPSKSILGWECLRVMLSTCVHHQGSEAPDSVHDVPDGSIVKFNEKGREVGRTACQNLSGKRWTKSLWISTSTCWYRHNDENVKGHLSFSSVFSLGSRRWHSFLKPKAKVAI